MFIIGSCEIEVKNGKAQLPEAFNLKSQVLSWYYANSTKTALYMRPERVVDKATMKELKIKQKKILVDKKNTMFLPKDIAEKSEGKILHLSGLADTVELEIIPC